MATVIKVFYSQKTKSSFAHGKFANIGRSNGKAVTLSLELRRNSHCFHHLQRSNTKVGVVHVHQYDETLVNWPLAKPFLGGTTSYQQNHLARWNTCWKGTHWPSCLLQGSRGSETARVSSQLTKQDTHITLTFSACSISNVSCNICLKKPKFS